VISMLKKGDADWKLAAKSETEGTWVEIPQEEVPIIHLPKVSMDSIIQNDYDSNVIYPLHSEWDDDTQSWGICANRLVDDSVKNDSTIVMSGDKFTECVASLNKNNRDGSTSKVSNTTIRILKLIRTWVSFSKRDVKSFYFCELSNDVWEKPQTMEIAVEQFKNIYDRAKAPYSEITLFQQSKDAVDEYLSRVVTECKQTWNVENRVMPSGWLCIDNKTQYYIGRNEYYEAWYRPDIRNMDKFDIWHRGTHFLKVGHSNLAITTLFLYAHFGFTLYWVKQANHSFESVLFLRGLTGLMKTSVAEEICNVFERNPKQKKLSFGSSFSSVRDTIIACRDNTVLLDDYSNSNNVTKKDATVLMEKVVRAIGDGQFPAKSMNDAIWQQDVETGIVITGEDDPNFSLSSNLRMVVVPVEEGTFDGKELDVFQYHPEIMRQYFSLFISFLQINGPYIVDSIPQKVQEYRDEYSAKFQYARIRDAAVNFRLQSDILSQFARWCGANKDEITTLNSLFSTSVLTILQDNEQSCFAEQPYIRFLVALMQSIDSNEKSSLADDKEQYVKSGCSYIGFREAKDNTIWVHPDDAFDLVRRYWKKKGNDFLTTEQRVKEQLFHEGVLVAKCLGGGRYEYVTRVSRGKYRRRLFVLRMNEINKILQERVE